MVGDNVDYEATIVAARLKVGATTPTGRRLSMLSEQMKNGVSVVQTLREMAQIRIDGGHYVHAHHVAVASADLSSTTSGDAP